MSDQNPVIFYPGKTQLMPVVLNIAVSPLLLYLLRLWPWPPTTLHLAVFIITTLIAVRYLKSQLKKPRLVFDEPGIISEIDFPAGHIRGVKPYMRALRIWIDVDDREKEKVINLWWASKEDLQRIYSIACERYTLRE